MVLKLKGMHMNKNLQNILIISIGIGFFIFASNITNTIINKILIIPLVIVGSGLMIYISKL